MRLIDADALLDKLICTSRYFTVKGDIVEAPTIDAVEVVRCKDCKYAELDDELYLCHHNGADWNSGEHFCSYGERGEQP